jgi:hypothetical protein
MSQNINLVDMYANNENDRKPSTASSMELFDLQPTEMNPSLARIASFAADNLQGSPGVGFSDEATLNDSSEPSEESMFGQASPVTSPDFSSPSVDTGRSLNVNALEFQSTVPTAPIQLAGQVDTTANFNAVEVQSSALAMNVQLAGQMNGNPYAEHNFGMAASTFSRGERPRMYNQRLRTFAWRERDPNAETVTIWIRDDKVGLIIGTGGEKVREIEKESGNCEVSTCPEWEAMMQDGVLSRPIRLTGTETQIRKAEHLIRKTIENAPELPPNPFDRGRVVSFCDQVPDFNHAPSPGRPVHWNNFGEGSRADYPHHRLFSGRPDLGEQSEERWNVPAQIGKSYSEFQINPLPFENGCNNSFRTGKQPRRELQGDVYDESLGFTDADITQFLPGYFLPVDAIFEKLNFTGSIRTKDIKNVVRVLRQHGEASGDISGILKVLSTHSDEYFPCKDALSLLKGLRIKNFDLPSAKARQFYQKYLRGQTEAEATTSPEQFVLWAPFLVMELKRLKGIAENLAKEQQSNEIEKDKNRLLQRQCNELKLKDLAQINNIYNLREKIDQLLEERDQEVKKEIGHLRSAWHKTFAENNRLCDENKQLRAQNNWLSGWNEIVESKALDHAIEVEGLSQENEELMERIRDLRDDSEGQQEIITQLEISNRIELAHLQRENDDLHSKIADFELETIRLKMDIEKVERQNNELCAVGPNLEDENRLQKAEIDRLKTELRSLKSIRQPRKSRFQRFPPYNKFNGGSSISGPSPSTV